MKCKLKTLLSLVKQIYALSNNPEVSADMVRKKRQQLIDELDEL